MLLHYIFHFLLEKYSDKSHGDVEKIIPKIKGALRGKNISSFVEIIKALFAGIPYNISLPGYEAYYHSIIYIVLKMSGIDIIPEKETNIGRIVQVIGPVIDAEFDPEHMPEIYNAVELVREGEGEGQKLVFEVAQHIGRNQVRAVAMDTTDGVRRGMEVMDTGQPITVPVGTSVWRPSSFSKSSLRSLARISITLRARATLSVMDTDSRTAFSAQSALRPWRSAAARIWATASLVTFSFITESISLPIASTGWAAPILVEGAMAAK